MRTTLPTLDQRIARSAGFTTPRRRWPGVLALGVIGIGIAAAVLTSLHDPQELLQRVEQRVKGTTSRPESTAPAQAATTTTANAAPSVAPAAPPPR